ncbi:alpha/beta hydrolase family protein [Winogradskyella alexanderae]|uniref:Alpha/beta hydrolase n=1 Tax=Winogradskyella alexanderae TaxID=2877123 RepID=A0ABS7XQ83_9FLAO|nr:alpha/beta fold hydrolase [Winogradskyella alexanderae]MCA0131196.1 alpha/beta hydrolase [Winogradskyella alexanderae]
MIVDKNIILKRIGEKPILIDVFKSQNTHKQPIILFCHGYKGFKDWGAWNIMAEEFAKAGFCFIKFNFSHNGGTVENPIDFPDLDAFGNNNYSKELQDLNDVIEWTVEKFKDNPNVDINNLNLIGHSRGGGVVTIKAEEDSRVSKVVSLAGVADFGNRFPKGQALDQWKKEGFFYVVNGRTKQKMPHFYQYYEDFKENEERLTIRRAASQLKKPHLIIHGDNDTSVSINEAYALHQWNPKSQLNIVEGADHVFNTRHPWNNKALSTELKSVINLTTTFIKQKPAKAN